nr:MAG: hypothetical protein CM15mV30_0950 [uncultured marine virus]
MKIALITTILTSVQETIVKYLIITFLNFMIMCLLFLFKRT